jgi:indole-3-glycerol phosphate synthase
LPNRSLHEVLATARRDGCPALVVDVKCRSPRDGELIPDARLESFVTALLAGGAQALSTPTDPQYFGGSLDIARRIRRLSGLPLMRKEFFRTVDQMDESLEAGFDAVQLTLSTLDPQLVPAMKARAEALGMDVVIGIHDQRELERALELGAATLGINNRDITALELDDGAANDGLVLLPGVPDDVLVLSESAFHTVDDVVGAARAGADGVLIGTAIAKSSDPAGMVRSLREGLQSWKRQTDSATA